MTYDDDELDSYDPIVAEQFALLDQLSPPEALEPVATVTTLHTQPPIAAPAEVARPLHLVAAAAALVAVAGLSVLALTNTGSTQDVDAGDDGNDETQIEGTADESGESQSLTVKVPTSAGSKTSGPAGGDASAEVVDETSTSTTQAAGNEPAESDSTDTSSANAVTTGSTEAPATNSSSTVASTETSVVTTPPATTATTASSLPAPGGSWLNPPTPEKSRVIRGTVTEVFTDCQSRLILNDAGEVESVGPVSCDGGSYIVVDGTRIQTTAGFGASEDNYSKHPANLRPGQRVSVTTVPTESAGGMLTLDCVLCRVTVTG